MRLLDCSLHHLESDAHLFPMYGPHTNLSFQRLKDLCWHRQ